MSTVPEIHDVAVQQLAEQYRARGFDVVIEPQGQERPAFLGEYQPDLIARGPSESVIVEVKVGTEMAHGVRLQPVAERVARELGWKFSLVVVGNQDVQQATPEKEPLPQSEISERIANAQRLVDQGVLDAAFLLVWSSVEAALRLLAERAHIPLATTPTSALFRELYSAGELSRAQYEAAMRALPTRNALVHGLSASLETSQVAELRGLAEELLAELSRPVSESDQLPPHASARSENG